MLTPSPKLVDPTSKSGRQIPEGRGGRKEYYTCYTSPESFKSKQAL
jgi:hypothetical protein